jgi:hypothetical protein
MAQSSAILPGARWRATADMPRPVREPVSTESGQPEALPGDPWPFPGRPSQHDRSTWAVSDDRLYRPLRPAFAALLRTGGPRPMAMITTFSL